MSRCAGSVRSGPLAIRRHQPIDSGQGTSRDARLGWAYYTFLSGQFVSNLGSALSIVLIPLLVYQITGSPLSLGLVMAAEFLPYPLFGLLLGAYVDRLSRRRVMIAADVGRVVVIASIPLLASVDRLEVWWIYLAGFLVSTLTIAFNAAEFAVVPTLAPPNLLATANGRLAAAYSTASVGGPVLAGLSLTLMSPSTALLLDAGSFVFSVGCLMVLRRALPEQVSDPDREPILRSIRTGIRFVFGHPVLRSCAILLALTNFFIGATVEKQIVVLAKQRFEASDSEVALLFAAGSVGVVAFSLVTGWLSRYLKVSVAILAPMFAGAVCIFLMGTLRSFSAIMIVWAVGSGLGMFFIINVRTLRQRLAPPEMLGRVVTVSQVVSWSPIPVGAVLGGWIASELGSAGVVFAGLGVIQFVIVAGFLASSLARADTHLAAVPTAAPEQAAQAPA